MGSEQSNERWRDLVAAREEFEREDVVVPICVSRIDGKPHPLSPKASQFAEALAISASWSRISEARHRKAA